MNFDEFNKKLDELILEAYTTSTDEKDMIKALAITYTAVQLNAQS